MDDFYKIVMSDRSKTYWWEETVDPDSDAEVWYSIKRAKSVSNMIRLIEDLSGSDMKIGGKDIEEIKLGLGQLDTMYDGEEYEDIPDACRNRVPDKIIKRYIYLWRERERSGEDDDITVA